MVKLGEIPEDLCVCVCMCMYISLSVLLVVAYVVSNQWYIWFLLQQVKSMQASESNIWPADKKNTGSICVEVLPALMLQLYKDKDLEKGQKKCRFNLVTWQRSQGVNCSPGVPCIKSQCIEFNLQQAHTISKGLTEALRVHCEERSNR